MEASIDLVAVLSFTGGHDGDRSKCTHKREWKTAYPGYCLSRAECHIPKRFLHQISSAFPPMTQYCEMVKWISVHVTPSRYWHVQHIADSIRFIFRCHRFPQFTPKISDLNDTQSQLIHFDLLYRIMPTLVKGIGLRNAGTAADLIIVCAVREVSN